MKQHIHRGRGEPVDPPPYLLAHYVDLNTGETYISRGTSYKEDWGSPILDKATLVSILNEFEEDLSKGEGLSSIVELIVTEIDGRRIVKVDVPLYAGRFISITDPTNSEDSYEIVPVIPYNETIRMGMELKLFNNTITEPTITHETDIMMISGSIPIAPSIQIKGVVTIKHVAVLGDKRRWLIYGDTSRSNTNAVAVAENSAKLDGFTRQQIITEARLMSENSRKLNGMDSAAYQTDIEAETTLGVVTAAIDAITTTI